jgi:hypothetical protein
VFGQVIESSPGFLNIDHSRTPQDPDSFTRDEWRGTRSG